ATSSGRNEPQQVLPEAAAPKKPLKPSLGVGPDHLRLGRRGEMTHDTCVTQWMAGRHISGDGWVGAPGNDNFQSGTGIPGEQRGDTVRVITDGDASILVEPIHHQDQAPSPLLAVLRGVVEHLEEMSVTVGGGQESREIPPEDRGKLFHDYID